MIKKINPTPAIIIIQKLKSAKTNNNIKKIIKDAWSSDSEEFFIGLELSLEKNNVNLISVPFINDLDDGGPGNYSFLEFYKMYQDIKNNTLSEQSIKSLILDAATKSNITEWNEWYRRILLKKLHLDLPINDIILEIKNLTNDKIYTNN